MFGTIMEKLSETYRIKNGWGLRAIRNDRELKALITFCYTELEQEYLSDKQRELYEATIDAYYLSESMDKTFKFKGKEYIDVYDLIEDYVGWYWS